MMQKQKLTEKDLYLPVKEIFEERGFEVKAEVNHCDLVAVSKTKTITVVELKLHLNLELMLQAMDRFLMTDWVYVAFPIPKPTQKSSIWNRKRHSILRLCRRVGVGLIGVHFHRATQPWAEVIVEPEPYTPRKNTKKANALLKEFESREGDFNLGGVNQKTIITTYRQDALRCARLLKMYGPLKVSKLKELGASVKAGNILRDNHYQWFERVERGIYQVTTDGLRGLDEFKWVVDKLRITPE